MTQWALTMPEDVDRSVRHYLQLHAETKYLSAFVQEAVGSEILRSAIKDIQANNRDHSPEKAKSLADEAAAWARENSHGQVASRSHHSEYGSN